MKVIPMEPEHGAPVSHGITSEPILFIYALFTKSQQLM